MRKRRIGMALIIVVLILFLGNPSEQQYLDKVVTDFGKTHHGISLNSKQLATMGKSNYHEFLIASRYEYAYGNIQVSYFGIAFTTFYIGSSRTSAPSPNPIKST